MDKNRVRELLTKWAISLSNGRKKSIEKAEQNIGGLLGPIKRTKGSPIIFDFESFENQRVIKKQLSEELPEWSSLIASEPAIMDGHAWSRQDFIDLYYSHYDMILEKLQRIVE